MYQKAFSPFKRKFSKRKSENFPKKLTATSKYSQLIYLHFNLTFMLNGFSLQWFSIQGSSRSQNAGEGGNLCGVEFNRNSSCSLAVALWSYLYWRNSDSPPFLLYLLCSCYTSGRITYSDKKTRIDIRIWISNTRKVRIFQKGLFSNSFKIRFDFVSSSRIISNSCSQSSFFPVSWPLGQFLIDHK